MFNKQNEFKKSHTVSKVYAAQRSNEKNQSRAQNFIILTFKHCLYLYKSYPPMAFNYLQLVTHPAHSLWINLMQA